MQANPHVNPRALCGAKNSSEAHGQGAEKSRYRVVSPSEGKQLGFRIDKRRGK